MKMGISWQQFMEEPANIVFEDLEMLQLESEVQDYINPK